MPPQFVPLCPDGLITSLAKWLPLAWAMGYALCVETLAFGLGLLILRWLWIIPRRAPMFWLLVAVCAVGALVSAEWMTSLNAQECSIIVPAHMTPTMQALLMRENAPFETHGYIALGIGSALFVLGTTITIVTFIRAWQSPRRRSPAAPAN